jgi:hypothetical protein
MEGFSWTISGATILVALGWFGTVAMFIWRRSNKEATDDAAFIQLRKDHDELHRSCAATRERHEEERVQVQRSRDEFRERVAKDYEGARKERDAFQLAMNAGLDAASGRLSEFKEHAAKTYATKSELISLEERTSKGMDRIVDRLEGISGRLETIGDSIMKALIDRPH